MRLESNNVGGQCAILAPGDRLDDIPETHRHLLTRELAAAFDNPIAHFRNVAERCLFPQMKQWLQRVIRDEDWDLALHMGAWVPSEYVPDPIIFDWAAVRWRVNGVQRAEIEPARDELQRGLPATLRQHYSLVDGVHWIPFAYSGNIERADGHNSLDRCCDASDVGGLFDPARAHIFATTQWGDMLFHTHEGRCGWLCHENYEVSWLESHEAMIEWVYGELNGNRSPNYPY